jgi:hypothetical protein
MLLLPDQAGAKRLVLNMVSRRKEQATDRIRQGTVLPPYSIA